MGLRAPARMTVEIREVAARPDPVRRFRLTRAVGRDGIDLEQPIDFGVGQPVLVRLRLPGHERLLELAGTVAASDDGPPRSLDLDDLGAEERGVIVAYVEERLGL
ncbi:MAG: hypothetical protein HY906_11685 [Deltaproteobacteria bacterium]|nr:hypothetical protein [Deltaproteobacteria bacterium]